MQAAWRGALAALVSGAVLLAPAGSAGAAPVYPPASGYLVDAAGVIPAAAEQQIEASLEDYHRRTKGEVAIALVKSLGDTSVENYAADLFQKWGVGSKDENLGVLLVLSTDERQQRIETGYGAEALLTDVGSKQILDGMTPLLQAGNFAGAVDQGQRQIRRALGDTQADAAVAAPTPIRSKRRSSGGGSLVFFLLPLLFMFFGSMGNRRRRRGGGMGWGLPIILGSTLGGGGYGGGGFGGSSGGGGGGGFGGFGGGDSGGGGASGGW